MIADGRDDDVRGGTLLLDRSATAKALEPRSLLDAIETALLATSLDTVSSPPRIAAVTPRGLLAAMPGYVPQLGLAAKIVSIFDSSPSGAAATHAGIVALFDESSGGLLCLMDGAVVTARRTAAVATLSMRYLANPHPEQIAVIGTGVQARAQVEILAALYRGAAVVVGGRSPERAEAVALLHPLGTTSAIEGAARCADVIFCCTSAREPVLDHSWIADGAHVSSVGGSGGRELSDTLLDKKEIFVEWMGAATSPPPAGAHELQGVAPERIILLGAVIGKKGISI